ncbi:ferric reductase-like transmembrane domain-containing protein [Candidatus Peregrinibacteria bacterium]|nr:ferric reductase-like transmembrane domain-containing protein [Candidatus Peregrinibacteria bacterium]
MEFLFRLIFDGRIPFMSFIRKLLYVLAFSPLVFLIFYYNHYKDFASYGWGMLVAVMLIRPLADVFTDLRILRTLVSLRRQFGIFTGFLLLSHAVGFFVSNQISFLAPLSDSNFWDFSGYISWGLLGIIAAIPVLITSNNFFIRILKSRWKTLQRLTYLLFIFGGIHIYMLRGRTDVLVHIGIVAFFWVLALFGVKIKMNYRK